MQHRLQELIFSQSRWPNGFASRLASSRKSQKAVNSTYIQLTCDHHVSTDAVGWSNGERSASTCLPQCKSSQVAASPLTVDGQS